MSPTCQCSASPCWCTGDERGGGDEAARKRKLREAQRLFTEMGTTARAA